MSNEHFWLLVGFVGQAFFTMRFVVQWIVPRGRRPWSRDDRRILEAFARSGGDL